MKKKKNKAKTNPLIAKMSAMIIEFAADYISLGKDLTDKQNYLNVACNAWNIAVLSEEERAQALSKFLHNYATLNPDLDDVDNVRHDIELLIQKKLELFPDVKRLVFSANIQEVDGSLSVTLLSTSPHVLKK